MTTTQLPVPTTARGPRLLARPRATTGVWSWFTTGDHKKIAIMYGTTAIMFFVAGGIGRGEAIAGFLEMGAAGVQLGTRFVCATESVAHPNFKRAFLRASARDAVASVQHDPRLPVIPVRALKNKGTELFTAKQREVAQSLDEGALAMAEAQLQIEHYWAGALRRAVIDGDVEHGSVMAGQSVGMVKTEEPVAEIIATLMEEAASALEKRAA